jgi:hypothetical protein
MNFKEQTEHVKSDAKYGSDAISSGVPLAHEKNVILLL